MVIGNMKNRSFPLCGRRKDHKMEENLRRLSHCLNQASEVVQQLASATSNSASNSAQTMVSTSGGMTSVSQAVSRARAMMHHSTSRGLYSRLGARERLRASSSTDSAPSNSKRPKVAKDKVFEFVLMRFDDENDEDLKPEHWMLTDENIVLRGLVTLNLEANELAVRKALCDAIQLTYPAVGCNDIVFLKANRRKLTKPVNCGEYSFKQVKSLTGQGAIYIKLKDGYSFLLDNGSCDGDDVGERSQVATQNIPDNNDERRPVSLSPETNAVNQASGNNHLNTEVSTDNLGEATAECIRVCKERDVSNPVEILKCAQKFILQGHPLDVTSLSQPLDGETNFVCIDRYQILKSAKEEVNDIVNPRLTLEVSFYGEAANDAGGPRKEFFRLCLKEIKDKYFGNGLNDLIAEEYEFVGITMALSILQNGPVPRFVPEEILQQIFSDAPPGPCIAELRKGFMKLGLYEIAKSLPLFLHLMRPNDANQLSRKQLVFLLKPSFSEEGTNARKYENDVYAAFTKYVRESAGGRRGSITLGCILQFATGLDEEPPLGFELQPCIQFVAAPQNNKWSFIPTANTCTATLFLPKGSCDLPLPTEKELFEVYDFAFSNSYFGLA